VQYHTSQHSAHGCVGASAQHLAHVCLCGELKDGSPPVHCVLAPDGDSSSSSGPLSPHQHTSSCGSMTSEGCKVLQLPPAHTPGIAGEETAISVHGQSSVPQAACYALDLCLCMLLLPFDPDLKNLSTNSLPPGPDFFFRWASTVVLPLSCCFVRSHPGRLPAV
jgi:hypothetical protein